MPKYEPLEVRFWHHVPDQPGMDCWEWVGCKDPKGYGRINVDRVGRLAHRISYALCIGDPGDLFVCHACDNPPCVNPSHLSLGTNDDNRNDARNKGRPFGRTVRDTCPKGHPYQDEFQPGVNRRCRICAAEYNRRWARDLRERYA